MAINRYSPNPRLIAPSTEQRMILAADGDYVRVDDIIAALKPEIAKKIEQPTERQTLEMIRQHIEFMQPDDYKKSAIWHITVKGLS